MASASTPAASIAISTPCCRTSCGPRRPAVPTPTAPRNSISSSSSSTARPDRRLRSMRSTTISPPRLQALSTSPGSYSAQAAVVGAAQALAQNLNSMTTSVQQLRTQAEQGIANDVQTANNALQQIAKINGQLEGTSTSDSAAAALEDQRDQDVTQLTQLMNVNVVQNANNQISVFTGNGQQLVAGPQASQLNFDNVGNVVGDFAMERQPEPGHRRHYHAGIARRHHYRSGRRQCDPVRRDRRLPANARHRPAASAESARRIGQPDVAGAVEPDDQRNCGRLRRAIGIRRRRRLRCCQAIRSRSPIPTPAMSSTRSRSSRSVPAARCRCRLRLQRQQPDHRRQFFRRHGFGRVAAQRCVRQQAAILQSVRHRAAGAQHSGSGNVVNALSATSTATSLTSGSPQLPLFLDGTSRSPARSAPAARKQPVSPAASRSTRRLSRRPRAWSPTRRPLPSGDPTRPNFILNQLTAASLTYSRDDRHRHPPRAVSAARCRTI